MSPLVRNKEQVRDQEWPPIMDLGCRSSSISQAPLIQMCFPLGPLKTGGSFYEDASAVYAPQHTQTAHAHKYITVSHVLNCTDLLLLKVLTNGKLFVPKDFTALIKRQLQF